mgnify:CR=1 FL=1
MDVLLNHYVFDGVKVLHIIIVVVGVILVMWIYPLLFKPKRATDVYETVRCLECGWTGQVSKYHRVCRKCNSKTLEKVVK